MYPWFWIWSPNIHMPLSGAVDEDIDSTIITPNMSAYFKGITEQAGNRQVERQAVAVASYGRQLGLITEVLIASAKKIGPLSDDAESSLQRLEEIQDSIEQIKTKQAATDSQKIEQQLQDMMQNNPEEFLRLKPRLLEVLNVPQQVLLT